MPKGQFSIDDVAGGGSGKFSAADVEIFHPVNNATHRDPTLPDSLPEEMLVNAPPVLAGIGAAALTGGMGVIPAALMTGGAMGMGSIAEQGARQATGINPPKNTKEFGERVGVDAALGLGSEFVSRGLSGLLEHTIGKYLEPESLYQSSLKPSGTNATKALKTVNAGIDEGITVNKGAAAVAKQRWLRLNGEIEDILNAKPKNIPAARWQKNVQVRFDKLRTKWGAAGSEGKKYLDQIDTAERNFLLHQGDPRPVTKNVTTMQAGNILGPNGQPIQTPVTKAVTTEPKDMSLKQLRRRVSPMPATKAQAIKKSVYEETRTKAPQAFEPNAHPALAARMQKEIAKSMRQEVIRLFPQIEIKALREGDLLELDNQLERFAKRESNKQKTPYFMFPIAGSILGSGFGAAHGVTGSSEGAALGGIAGHMIRSAIEDPAIKSRLAIMISRSRGMSLAQATKWVAKRVPAVSMEIGGTSLEERNQPPPNDD